MGWVIEETQPNRPLGSGSGFPNDTPVFTIDVGCQILTVFYKNITWSSPLGKRSYQGEVFYLVCQGHVGVGSGSLLDLCMMGTLWDKCQREGG